MLDIKLFNYITSKDASNFNLMYFKKFLKIHFLLSKKKNIKIMYIKLLVLLFLFK